MVGSLIYLMSITRPDLCFMITKLSQFLNNPTRYDLGLAKDVLRYIKCTNLHNFAQIKMNYLLKCI